MPLIDLAKGKVKDSSGKLTYPDDYSNAVAEALKTYSKHRPRPVPEDIAGNGTHDLPLPSKWSEGFSAIQRIEYPIGNVPETLLDVNDWSIYQGPAGKTLRIITDTPAIGESIRVLYSALHDETTVAAADTDAVANLAASLCLRMLAAVFGQTSDPTIQADVVNYRTKADEFRRLADSFQKLYDDHLGIKADSPVPAASATAGSNEEERMRLTHHKRSVWPK